MAHHKKTSKDLSLEVFSFPNVHLKFHFHKSNLAKTQDCFFILTAERLFMIC